VNTDIYEQNNKNNSGEGRRYVAVIGDIRGSRKLSDRAACQLKLEKVLDDINDRYAAAIASRLTITIGDEFQGLFTDGSPVLDALTRIAFGMHPVSLRFGIGIGSMSTEVNPLMSIGADGPAYHLARAAVDSIKETEGRNCSAPCSLLVYSGSSVDLYVNSSLKLLHALSAAWSERQREIIIDMLLHRDSQTKVAARHGITQPTVQKILSSGNYYSFQASYDAMVHYLSEVKSIGL
jgi:hypothetical protein